MNARNEEESGAQASFAINAVHTTCRSAVASQKTTMVNLIVPSPVSRTPHAGNVPSGCVGFKDSLTTQMHWWNVNSRGKGYGTFRHFDFSDDPYGQSAQSRKYQGGLMPNKALSDHNLEYCALNANRPAILRKTPLQVPYSANNIS
jgi:hypothetical protein